jgi:anti-anti-sigma regulatory factor
MGRIEKPITVTIVGEITEEHQKAWAERLTMILETQYGVEGCRQILEELKKE